MTTTRPITSPLVHARRMRVNLSQLHTLRLKFNEVFGALGSTPSNNIDVVAQNLTNGSNLNMFLEFFLEERNG